MFFETYSNKEKYQLFEFGLPYLVSENMSVIIRKLKRKCDSINNKLLGYVWVHDVGEENFGHHFHLVIATNKINDYKYPNALKLDFKGNKIHGDFVKKDDDSPTKTSKGVRALHKGKWGYMKDKKFTSD